MNHSTSPAAYGLIKRKETLRLDAYPDPQTGDEPWTVGWGATGPGIEDGTVWTRSQADQRLVADVCFREDIIRQSVTVPLTQGQFDALVSILYNVGAGRADMPGQPGRDGIITLRNGHPSTLLRKLNAGDYDGARAQFLQWVSPGSNVEHGLTVRREEELELWDQPGEARWLT
jgi:lysozyme